MELLGSIVIIITLLGWLIFAVRVVWRVRTTLRIEWLKEESRINAYIERLRKASGNLGGRTDLGFLLLNKATKAEGEVTKLHFSQTVSFICFAMSYLYTPPSSLHYTEYVRYGVMAFLFLAIASNSVAIRKASRHKRKLQQAIEEIWIEHVMKRADKE